MMLFAKMLARVPGSTLGGDDYRIGMTAVFATPVLLEFIAY